MPDAPKLLALDIASKTGWAIGPAGDMKRSGTVNLRPGKDDPVETAWLNIGYFLKQMFVFDKPDVVICEAAMPASQGSGGNAVTIAWGCLAVVKFWCHLFGVQVRYANVAQVRAHYTGQARHVPPDDFKPRLKDQSERRRQWTKSVIVRKAHARGHMPMGCSDDNRGDACAIFDFASVVWYRVAPKELHMLGELA